MEHFSVVPYTATLLNCMLWVLYGMPFVKPNSTLVVTINGAGTVIELAYVFIYLLYSNGSRRIKALLLLFADFAFIIAVAAIVLSLFKTNERRTLIIGILCIVFCILMYFSPLSIMVRIIHLRDYRMYNSIIQIHLCFIICFAVVKLI